MAASGAMVVAGEHLSSSRPARRAKTRPAARIPLCVEPPPPFAEGPGPGRDWWEKALSEKSFRAGKHENSQQNQSVGAKSRTTNLGPFGEVIRATGPMAKVNPFRFATQYYDDETDIIMYPHRPYSPSTGRWLSRDQIEEEGGENLYIFCGNDSLNNWDLLGDTWKVKRDGGVKAQATPEQGDTVNDLASMIGLNPADYQQWLTVSSGSMPSSASEKLNGCGNFQIPNEVIAFWGGDAGAIGRWWVSWNSNVRYLKARGFYVDEVHADPATQTGATQSELEASASSKTLHGLYFWGHGNVQGVGSRRRFPLVNYGDTTLPTIHLNYKMALALVFACESNSGQPALSAGTAGSIWHGYTGILYPVNPWRSDFKVKTYLHKGDQATKP
jgi:RHS repeat-associated protein